MSEAVVVVPPLIVGVCLVNDTDHAHSHNLTTITLSPSHLSKHLVELRPLIKSALPSSLSNHQFSFISRHGWEITVAMETTATIEQVFRSQTHSVWIKFSHSQPRIGLVAEGTPSVPLGFIFCDIDVPLIELKIKIHQQLPQLHAALVATGYSILDNNGWPIGEDQETIFSLTDVVVNKTITLRVYSNQMTSLGPASLAVVKATNMTSSQLSITPDPAQSLRPVVEESVDTMESSLLEQSLSLSPPGTTPYEMLISYVHRESSDEAISLREALQEMGYRVFLDVECIRSGTDWQDVLNDAVSNCTVFVPLTTQQYGQTLWTNREVKLADVLGKIIIPVSFLSKWPPPCLAIQFATTQYITWPHSSTTGEWNEDTVGKVAKEIVERYRLETQYGMETIGVISDDCGGVIRDDGGEEEEEEGEMMELGAIEKKKSFSRADTQIIEKDVEMEGSKVTLGVPVLARGHRRSTIKSYASSLPSSLPVQYRKSIQESRTGKSLVVISCHKAQQEYAREVAMDMEGCGYEAWCSCDILHLPITTASPIFQQRANEAGVIIFIFSKEFTENSFCENQVYYCEQRKRIIPVVYEAIQLPNWVCLLIGTSPFISCQSSGHRQQITARVGMELNPDRREVSLHSMLKEKAEVARLCAEVTRKLPKGRSLIYISGGTRFYSADGEQICRKLGRHLAQDSNVVLVTGGFYGVGETVGRSFHEERERRGQDSGVWHLIAKRDDLDRSSQTRQNDDGTFSPLPYGHTVFAGSSVRQREVITPHVVKVCVLVEGGPGAAFEAQQFSWNGNYVIPVRVTGGAAAGLFNVPQAIFQRPPVIDESDWSVLGNSDATSSDIAAALVRIIRTLNFNELKVKPKQTRTRKVDTGRYGVLRSETLPQGSHAPSHTHNDTPVETGKKRTYSDSISSSGPDTRGGGGGGGSGESKTMITRTNSSIKY